MANFLKSLFVKGVEIDTAGAITGDVLKYDGSKFGAASAGGSSVGDLDDLSDVVITTPKNGELLEFNGTNWVNNVRVGGEPIGHTNKSQSTISFDEGNRRFSIAPVSGSFEVWCKGIKYTKTTTETVDIPDTSGLYYIYYSNTGVLSYRTSYFDWENDTPTAYIYWNEVDNKAYFFADERHGVVLDWQTHEYLHRTRGAAIANGFGANNYILNGDGDSDTHAKIDIANGTFFDEDLQVDITHSDTPTANTWEQVLQGNAEIPVFYRLNNHWVKDAATEFPMKQGTDRPRYNLNTAGTWSTPDVQNNHFGVSWIIATNNLNEPVIAILGQGSYTDKGSAQSEFYASLNLDGFPIVEFRPLYKIIYECKTSYTNTPSAQITDVIDLRSIISSDQGVGTTPVSDHGSLTGLGDDDHTQYLLADGSRNASSLTVTGALSSSTLNIDSGTLYVDATNNRIGINDTTPDYTLDISEGTLNIDDAVGLAPNYLYTRINPYGLTVKNDDTSTGQAVGSVGLTPYEITISGAGNTPTDYSAYGNGFLTFTTAGGSATLVPATLTGSRTITMPNASGTIALITVSDTAPTAPATGSLWFKSDTGNLLVYYDSYWIDAAAPAYSTLDGGTA